MVTQAAFTIHCLTPTVNSSRMAHLENYPVKWQFLVAQSLHQLSWFAGSR